MKSKAAIIDDIGARLYAEFQSAVPKQHELPRKGRKLAEQDIQARIDTGLKRFYQRADEEKSRHQLGILGKAKVAFNLQKRLLEAGYPAPLVKQVLMAMLVSVFAGGR